MRYFLLVAAAAILSTVVGHMSQAYETIMGALGIIIAPVWLYLIWLSVRSGATWGWPTGPRRSEQPAFFWSAMLVYLGLAIGFAARGASRL